MGTIEVISGIAQLLQVASEAVSAATAASTTLKKAHEEGWQDNDPRWTVTFAELDDALAKANARLT